MTPIEKKAREIYERFVNVECLQDFEGMDYELAKQCALICVDEIINEYQSMSDLHTYLSFNDREDENSVVQRISFYQKVKNHIEKL